MSGEAILLACADPLRREKCSACLGNLGYRLMAVSDGLQVLEAVQAGEVALAFLDQDLPGCSGTELLTRLKAQSAGTEVILLNMHATLASAGQDEHRGAYPCQRCDLGPKDPAEVVAGVLERRHLARENRTLQNDLRLAQEELARQGVLLGEARSQATLDGLTGLYNYRHFWELLAHEVEMSRRYGCPLSLLFLDVDRFKDVNDALGHAQGDAVLKDLASYLKSALRQADVACRYGGEEFVVILPRTTAAQAETLAERLRHGVCTGQLCLVSRQVQLSVSIGVAELQAGMDADSLLKAADAALYRAKVAGRNRVCGPA